jgi:hypothetical protein
MWGSNYKKASAENEGMKSAAICNEAQVHNITQIQDQALHLYHEAS